MVHAVCLAACLGEPSFILKHFGRGEVGMFLVYMVAGHLTENSFKNIRGLGLPSSLY